MFTINLWCWWWCYWNGCRSIFLTILVVYLLIVMLKLAMLLLLIKPILLLFTLSKILHYFLPIPSVFFILWRTKILIVNSYEILLKCILKEEAVCKQISLIKINQQSDKLLNDHVHMHTKSKCLSLSQLSL